MNAGEKRYATPAAFRRALTDHLKKLAENSEFTLTQLQRQIAYDRWLERVFRLDSGWVLKGATALLARRLSARGTLDVDLYRDAGSEQSEAALRLAADEDLGDWFRFDVSNRIRSEDVGAGARFLVLAYVGTTEWASFHVDLVGADLRMTGQPDQVSPLAPLAIPEIVQHGYRAYPLVDHVADKLVATFDRYGPAMRPSTRYKDLVDLVSIIQGASIDAGEQLRAIKSESARRDVALPQRFSPPDLDLWRRGYAAEARDMPARFPRTLEEALAVVSPFLDPLLDGTASGKWDPKQQRWRS
jgi:hypothetical protein